MEFDKKVKFLRTQYGLTQTRFAQKINSSRKTVSGWENKRSYPNVETLYLISNTFQIPFQYLTEDISFNEFKRKILNDFMPKKVIQILAVTQLVLILVEYLTLLGILQILVNTILLLINTLIINFLFRKNRTSLKTSIKSICFFLNGVLGLLFLSEELLMSPELKLELLIGDFLGTLFIIVLLSFSIFSLIKILKELQKWTG